MSGTTWERLAAATGILSVLLFVGAFALVPEAPELGTASDAEIRAYLVDHAFDLRLGALLLTLSTLALLWFLGSLRSALLAAEGQPGRLTALMFGAGLVTVATYLVWAGLTVEGVASKSMGSYDADTLRSIFVVSEIAPGPIGAGTVARAAMMGAAALAALRFGGLPKWLGWVAGAIALGSLAGIFTLVEPDPTEGPMDAVWFFSWLAFHLWILLAGIVLVARPRARAEAAGPMAAA